MALTLKTLLRRFTFWAGGIALAALLGLSLLAGRGARRTLERLSDQRGTDVAARAAALVANYVRERHVEADQLAANPYLIRAAIDAAQTVVARRLDQVPPADLERMFAGTRRLEGDPELLRYLRSYPGRSEFTDLTVTERHGLVVIASGVPERFRNADDPLWRRAFAEGVAESDPVIDSATSSVTVHYAVALRPEEGARAVGVLEGAYQLDRVGWLLTGIDLGDSTYLQLVDKRGNLLYAPAQTEQRTVPKDTTLYNPTRSQRAILQTARGPELVVSVPAPRGRFPANEASYWVLFREPTSVAYASARGVQRYVWLGVPGLLVLLGALLWGGVRWLDSRVSRPVQAVSRIAGRVAAGDLSVVVATMRTEAAEVGDLLSSVHSMIVALRRLVGAIRTAADEAAAMAAEISGATQEMSASTQELTSTAQDLSRKAADQAQLVRSAADDAGRILHITSILASGSEEAARRNTALSGVARRNKEVLDQSTAQLAKLAEDVEKGAAEAEALTKAAQDIQKFVAQAKAVATQTNMLALNAAIEAARAGPQGRGFAVVADEVRKLASQAAISAGETADTVRGVTTRVQATRDRLLRLAQGGAAAREAAQSAAQGLATVAGEADANDAWSREIATSATEVKRLVEEIAARLTEVARGTEALLASAEEIAASSEEQSASTEEIASSANQLAEAADKLQGAVKTFRLLQDEAVEPTRQAAD